MKIIITRHGETEENKQGIIQGHLNGTLSELGVEQAKKLANRLKNEKIDLIFSSDLDRAKNTAEEIAKFHPKVPFELKKELRERFLGNFQGGIHDEKWQRTKFDEKLMGIEGGELLGEMHNRAKNFIDNLKKNHPKENILLVAHHGIGIALINHVLGGDYKKMIEIEELNNTSITIFEFDENGNPKLILFNCVRHLED